MIRRSWILGAWLALTPVVSHAGLMVMFEGIPGPHKYAPYGGWFQAQSVDWSVDRANAAKPFRLSVAMEQAGPGFASLTQLAFTGQLLKKIVIDQVEILGNSVPEGAQVVVLRLTCEDAQLRTQSTSADSDGRPDYQVDISCGRFGWEHFDADNKGGVTNAGKGSWNFKTNTP